jgi:hypothetical protein
MPDPDAVWADSAELDSTELGSIQFLLDIRPWKTIF